jgi:hypothetical protein
MISSRICACARNIVFKTNHIIIITWSMTFCTSDIKKTWRREERQTKNCVFFYCKNKHNLNFIRRKRQLKGFINLMEQNAVGTVIFWPFLSWWRWQFYTKAITKILHKYIQNRFNFKALSLNWQIEYQINAGYFENVLLIKIKIRCGV